ncbi:hypothetical protein X748_29780 [Mesorhizobium sp. LNJC386A00]|nr:hypothetical protein X748_29780 [Mesorhizobium sp. LNJC386A00]
MRAIESVIGGEPNRMLEHAFAGGKRPRAGVFFQSQRSDEAIKMLHRTFALAIGA